MQDYNADSEEAKTAKTDQRAELCRIAELVTSQIARLEIEVNEDLTKVHGVNACYQDLRKMLFQTNEETKYLDEQVKQMTKDRIKI
mgnify:CR=1 FL=1